MRFTAAATSVPPTVRPDAFACFIAMPAFDRRTKCDRNHVEAHHDAAPKYEWQGTSKASE